MGLKGNEGLSFPFPKNLGRLSLGWQSLPKVMPATGWIFPCRGGCLRSPIGSYAGAVGQLEWEVGDLLDEVFGMSVFFICVIT